MENSDAQILIESFVPNFETELIGIPLLGGPVLIAVGVYPSLGTRYLLKWYSETPRKEKITYFTNFWVNTRHFGKRAILEITTWPKIFLADLTRSVSVLAIFIRVIVFRVFAITLAITGWSFLGIPVFYIENIIYLIILFGFLVGLGALILWQIVSGILTLWTDIWRRTTPPHPKPLASEVTDFEEEDQFKIELWDRIPRTIDAYQPVNTRESARSIWEGFLLGCGLVALGVVLFALYLLNEDLDLRMISILFTGLGYFAEEILIVYGPIVDAGTAKALAAFGVLTAPAGMIIAKNTIYLLEKWVYHAFEYTGRHTQISILLLMSTLTITYVWAVIYQIG